jgi:putative tryptophan/tyrosine transport system substrate-binding protein
MPIRGMKRRTFIAALGSVAALPFAAHAQQSSRLRRVAVLMGQAESDVGNAPRATAFRQELARLGWTEDRNVRIDYRWGAGDTGRLQTSAKELLSLVPDVAVAESTAAVLALSKEAPALPIVFLQAGNPVGSGFVASFAHPGGNITGFTNFEPSMASKWIEVLKEIAPDVRRFYTIFNPDTHTGQYWTILETAAPLQAVELIRAPVHDVGEIEHAIEAMVHKPNGGLLAVPDPFTITYRDLIIRLTTQYRLPAVYAFGFFARGGGLVSYGVDVVEDYRRAASYIDRILRGEKPANLPVQAPTKFELVINLNTAKALGLTIPATLLARADEVIE